MIVNLSYWKHHVLKVFADPKLNIQINKFKFKSEDLCPKDFFILKFQAAHEGSLENSAVVTKCVGRRSFKMEIMRCTCKEITKRGG